MLKHRALSALNLKVLLQVCAVVVYLQAKLEADSSSLSPVVDQDSSNLYMNEDVFISQLIRRALLLNSGFQKKVTGIVQQHAVNNDFFCFLRTPSTAVTSSELYERARSSAHEHLSIHRLPSSNFAYERARSSAHEDLSIHRVPSSNFGSSEIHERTGSSNKTGGAFNAPKVNANLGFKLRYRLLSTTSLV